MSEDSRTSKYPALVILGILLVAIPLVALVCVLLLGYIWLLLYFTQIAIVVTCIVSLFIGLEILDWLTKE